ncbi:Tigger transposable element-derived protein 6 [Frankliniella fusca]|uniref:Tigger transposable element-derived protein 6 n=1 Tax=Frankliniella fusca TaxID=407009 RepID=A0AAE1I0J5_9NEOP|nr:Tigger transposable element-derived protein 6 [Frankliniella fusca]
MSEEAFPGTLCLANKSGWMTREMFFEAIKHFIQHSNSSKDNPSLLVYDNVDSHLTIDVIRPCKENGVTLFTVPPHTTHKTQPLDVGIVPFNDQIFQEHEFVKSSVTFIPEEQHNENLDNEQGGNDDNILNENEQEAQEICRESVRAITFNIDDNSEASTARQANNQNDQEKQKKMAPIRVVNANENQSVSGAAEAGCSTVKTHISPKNLWGIPKLVRKESQRKPRRKGKSAVPTDTPEKDEIERRELEKQEKERIANQRKKGKGRKKNCRNF